MTQVSYKFLKEIPLIDLLLHNKEILDLTPNLKHSNSSTAIIG